MKPIQFHYNPKVALKFIDKIVEQCKADKEETAEMKKVYEDIKTLAHLGAKCLSKEPINDPTESGNQNN